MGQILKHVSALDGLSAAEIAALGAVTASAAELDKLQGVAAGTVTASKAVVVGASKNLDVLAIADGGLSLGAGAGTAVTATAAELNNLDGPVAGTVSASKAVVVGANKNLDVLAIADGGLSLGAGAGTAISATAVELNKTDGIPATAYLQAVETRDFTESTGAGAYTATVTIPAGAVVFDVIWFNDALWSATTSADLDVGDADDPNGYFAAVDVKAAPIAAVNGAGGISSKLADVGSGAFGGLTRYYPSGGTITATVTTVGAAGATGVSRLWVLFATPTSVAAVKA